MQFLNVEIQPTTILAGKLRTPLEQSVFVEFLVDRALINPKHMGQLRGGLPKADQVWFLQWGGEGLGGTALPSHAPAFTSNPRMYQTVSFESVFVHTDTGVANAFAANASDGPAETMGRKGAQFTKLSELAAYVRSTPKGRPE